MRPAEDEQARGDDQQAGREHGFLAVPAREKPGRHAQQNGHQAVDTCEEAYLCVAGVKLPLDGGE